MYLDTYKIYVQVSSSAATTEGARTLRPLLNHKKLPKSNNVVFLNYYS